MKISSPDKQPQRSLLSADRRTIHEREPQEDPGTNGGHACEVHPNPQQDDGSSVRAHRDIEAQRSRVRLEGYKVQDCHLRTLRSEGPDACGVQIFQDTLNQVRHLQISIPRCMKRNFQ